MLLPDGTSVHHGGGQQFPPSFAPDLLSFPNSVAQQQIQGQSFITPSPQQQQNRMTTPSRPNIIPGSQGSGVVVAAVPGLPLATTEGGIIGMRSVEQTPIAPTGRAYRLQEMPRAVAPPGLFDDDKTSNEPTPKARKSTQNNNNNDGEEEGRRR